jgi:hypothetical protein
LLSLSASLTEVKGLLPSSMPASAIRNQYEVIQQDSSSN